jgi:hypothetical protein
MSEERQSTTTRKKTMKQQHLWFSLGILAAIGTSVSGAGQSASPPRTKIDLSRLGPQVGERVPDFSLRDQNGNSETLQSIMGPKGAMLVFIRSADW